MFDTMYELQEELMWGLIPVEKWGEAFRLYALGADLQLDKLLGL